MNKPGLCAFFAVMLAVYVPVAAGHWPDQSPHQFASLGDFKVEGGGVISNLKISFVTHGKLNADKTNAVLVLHGFGLNHHQFDHLIGP
jgi:homoserine O-acetyltransferase